MFSDCQNHWAISAIVKLAERNLIRGYPDQTFRPDAPVTRAEFAVLMCNCFPHASVIKAPIQFKDVPSNHWANQAIKTAVSKGFLAGYPNQIFQPNQNIPRVQAIIALAAHLKLLIPEPPLIPQNQTKNQFLKAYFDDTQDIPQYAQTWMTAATFNYLVVNTPPIRKLQPNKSATRGEIAAILCQALNLWSPELLLNIPGGSNFAICPTFDQAFSFSEGRARVLLKDGFGWIDTSGKVIILPQAYDYSYEEFSHNLLAFVKQNKIGFMNTQGEVILSPQYSLVTNFSEGLAGAKLDQKLGYIDQTGAFVIQPQFDSVQPFKEGLAPVEIQGKWGYIDRTGNLIVHPQFDYAMPFSGGLGRVILEGKQGFVNLKGEVVISPQFSQCESFSEGLAKVKLDEGFGFINPQGEIVIQTSYNVQSFSEGLAAVEINGKWGFMDQTGATVIPPQFYGLNYQKSNVIEPFSEGLSRVRFGERCGFINPKGEFVIPPQFCDASSFSNGLACVNIGGKWNTRSTGYDSSAMPVDFETILEGGKWGYIKQS